MKTSQNAASAADDTEPTGQRENSPPDILATP